MTIRFKLMLAFLAFAAVPIIAIGVIISSNAKDSLEEARISGLESTADLKVAKIDDFLEGLERDIRASQDFFNLRTNLPIVTEFADDRTNPVYLAAKAMLDLQLTGLRTSHEFLDIVLVSPENKIVYGSNKHYEDRLGSDSVDMAFRESKPGINLGNIYAVESSPGRFAMWVSAPIQGHDGKFVGLVGFEIDMGPLFEFIQDRPASERPERR